MHRRVGRAVAAAVVVGAVVSGCGSGPSQLGSAVIVGSDVVSLSQVQERIAVALSPAKAQAVEGRSQGRGAPYGPPEVAREIVTGEILADLLDRRIAEEGIVVDDATLNAAVSSVGSPEELDQASIYAPDVQREKIRDDVAAAALGARYVDRLAVTLEFTAFGSEEEALAAAQAVAAGGPGAEAVFAAAPQEGQAQEVRAADNPALASSFAFGSPVGSVIVLRPASQDAAGWTLIHIIERADDAPPQGPSAVDRLGQQDLQLIGYRLLQEQGSELGIEVNPRYGVWDPIQLMVVDADQTAGTIVMPPAPE